MPSESRAQHRTMEAAEHDPEFRRKMGIPKKVAEEFTDADKHSSNWKKRERVKKADLCLSPEIARNLFGDH